MTEEEFLDRQEAIAIDLEQKADNRQDAQACRDDLYEQQYGESNREFISASLDYQESQAEAYREFISSILDCQESQAEA